MATTARKKKGTTNLIAGFQASLLGWLSGQLSWATIPNNADYMHLLEHSVNMSLDQALAVAKTHLPTDVGTQQLTDTARYIMAAQYFNERGNDDPRLSALYYAAIQKGKDAGVIDTQQTSDGTIAVYNSQAYENHGTGIGGGEGKGTTTPGATAGDSNANGIPDSLEQILAGSTDTSAADAAAQQAARRQREIQQKNAAATFSQTIGYWGLNTTGGIQNIIDQASKAGWSSDRFLQAISGTDAFQERFKGIFDPKSGSLKMTPEQYIQTEQAYQAYAAQYGINLNGGKEAFLFRNNVNPQVAAQRFQTEATLRDNSDFFKAYNQELKQEGKDPLDKQGLFQLVMGEGNKEYQQLLERAQTRYAGEQAGIHFGNAANAYLNISERQVKKIGGKNLSPEQLQASFQQTAQDLLTTLPLSRIQKYGLKKNDILQARFGGKKQADVLQLMQHIQQQESAFYQDRASATLYATAQGVETLGGAGTKAAQ